MENATYKSLVDYHDLLYHMIHVENLRRRGICDNNGTLGTVLLTAIILKPGDLFPDRAPVQGITFWYQPGNGSSLFEVFVQV